MKSIVKVDVIIHSLRISKFLGGKVFLPLFSILDSSTYDDEWNMLVYPQYIVNISVFNALSIGTGLVAAAVLCIKREHIIRGACYLPIPFVQHPLWPLL